MFIKIRIGRDSTPCRINNLNPFYKHLIPLESESLG